MTYKNNIMRSAVWDKMCDDTGHLLPEIFDVYKNLSLGGVGIICTGFARVIKEEAAVMNQMAMYDDKFISEYKTLTDIVHNNDTKIYMQLAVGGSQSMGNCEKIYSPSGITNEVNGNTSCAMSIEDINYVINSFGDAAKRAQDAGFDGVVIHAAHGYLISQFLCPLTNKRDDKYGLDRNLFLIEVYNNIKSKVNNDLVIGMKINCEDLFVGGVTLENSINTCKLMDSLGIDFIEISGGFGSSKYVVDNKLTASRRVKGNNYFVEQALEIKSHVKTKVAVTGGICDISSVKGIDIIGLARPLIAEPDYVNKYLKDNKYKAACVRCGQCVGSICTNKNVREIKW